jgi:hypothetical protein
MPTIQRHDRQPDIIVSDADMALIAAAPEMLEALEDLVSSCKVLGTEGLDPELAHARAAIAKARGTT